MKMKTQQPKIYGTLYISARGRFMEIQAYLKTGDTYRLKVKGWKKIFLPLLL